VRRRIAVLASGAGSNMQALGEACRDGRVNADLALVIANTPGAEVLQRAGRLAVPQRCIDHRDYGCRAEFDDELRRCLLEARIDLVVLAGFMRILSDDFVREFYGSLLNIHPSLLPKYPGLNTHRRALDAGDRYGGSTVHFVIPELDAGPPVLQARVKIHSGDTPESLAQRVRAVEHSMYPLAVGWWVDGRLKLTNAKAELDGKQIDDAAALALAHAGQLGLG
jgi:phosphoribosylglycinamide formyltransferase-1